MCRAEAQNSICSPYAKLCFKCLTACGKCLGYHVFNKWISVTGCSHFHRVLRNTFGEGRPSLANALRCWGVLHRLQGEGNNNIVCPGLSVAPPHRHAAPQVARLRAAGLCPGWRANMTVVKRKGIVRRYDYKTRLWWIYPKAIPARLAYRGSREMSSC